MSDIQEAGYISFKLLGGVEFLHILQESMRISLVISII
jgi:hypothetical protein